MSALPKEPLPRRQQPRQPPSDSNENGTARRQREKGSGRPIVEWVRSIAGKRCQSVIRAPHIARQQHQCVLFACLVARRR